MKLHIISLKGMEYDDEAISVNIKTTSGEITVLDNHRPLLTQLVTCKAIITDKNNDKFDFNIDSGFMEIGKGNQTTILAG